jgi:hypothetical protein
VESIVIDGFGDKDLGEYFNNLVFLGFPRSRLVFPVFLYSSHFSLLLF